MIEEKRATKYKLAKVLIGGMMNLSVSKQTAGRIQ
jgi:hypothetical protein